ncbi:sensor histidine kinase [Gracilimonas sp.]|uniref:sensor histidine kinase n=1 Tax=Gracilimonas sp. TaxID=1974203 RepID=UPI003D10B517
MRFCKLFNKKLLMYLVFWAASFYAGLEVFSRTGDIRTIDVIYTFLFHVPLVIIVSLHAFLLIPNYLAKSRFWLYGLTLIVLLGMAYPAYNFSFLLLSDWLFPGYYLVGVYGFIEVTGFAVLYLILSSTLEFGRSWFEVLRSRNKIAELESEKRVSELKALRAQVNPHFLFNSLNTIYSEALKKSDKAPALILKLSDMLRYVVDKMDQEQVLLEEEIEYLTHFVDLHKERLNEPDKVHFSTEGDFSGRKIAPLLLIIFVENCFKHADLTDEEALISIQIKQEAKGLILHCKNTVYEKGNKEEKTSGTGLQNAKRRLDLAYGGSYSLDINQQENLYELTLKLGTG